MAEGLLQMLGSGQQAQQQQQGNLLGGLFQSESQARRQGRERLLGQALQIAQQQDPIRSGFAVAGGLLGEGIGRAMGRVTPEEARQQKFAGLQTQLMQEGLDPVQNPAGFYNRVAELSQDQGDMQTALRAAAKAREFAPEPVELPARARTLAFQAQQAGLEPGTDEYRKFMLTGGETEQGPDVNVSIDQRAKSAFETEFAKQDAQTFSNIGEAGVEANRTLAQIDRLSNLLDKAPQGLEGSLKFAAGNFGIPTENLSEIQAAQALINQLVPSQREPGSGPMSDADLELFKQSIARLINQPEGNKLILDTMRGIAEYDKKGAEIVNQFREGNITRTEAFNKLAERNNPLQDIGFGGEAAAGQVPVTAPNGEVFLFPTQEAANEFKQRIGID